MKPADIIGYEGVVRAEHTHVQKGMNYNLDRGNYVLLMSTREDASYEDMIEEQSGMLIYEGHDVPRTPGWARPLVSGSTNANSRGYMDGEWEVFSGGHRLQIWA